MQARAQRCHAWQLRQPARLPGSLRGAPRLPSRCAQVLMKDGVPMLRAFLENAEPFPIRGLLR